MHSSSAVMEELQAQWLQPFKDFKNERGGEGLLGWGVRGLERERERDGHFRACNEQNNNSFAGTYFIMASFHSHKHLTLKPK